jgi:hypothetical protein
MKALASENAFVKQIPIEGFEMADIKDDAVTFGDGAFVEGIGIDHSKQVVSALTGVRELLDEIVADGGVALRG